MKHLVVLFVVAGSLLAYSQTSTSLTGQIKGRVIDRDGSPVSGATVYAVLRADAVDVVYGTMEGYEALGIPYMPHIPPEKRW